MDTTKLSKRTQLFLKDNLPYWEGKYLPMEVIKGMIEDIDHDLKVLEPDKDKGLVDKYKRIRREISDL